MYKTLSSLVNQIFKSSWFANTKFRQLLNKYGKSGIGTYAARHGHLDIIQWLFDQNIYLNLSETAAQYGHLHILQWMVQNNYRMSPTTCEYAAMGGQLHILQWLRQIGTAWDSYTCYAAVANGHLHVFEWAYKNDCPLDEIICNRVAENGNLDLLKYLRTHKCPWEHETAVSACLGGHLNILIWLYQNQCPIYFDDVDLYEIAIDYCHYHILKWLIENEHKALSHSILCHIADDLKFQLQLEHIELRHLNALVWIYDHFCFESGLFNTHNSNCRCKNSEFNIFIQTLDAYLLHSIEIPDVVKLIKVYI